MAGCHLGNTYEVRILSPMNKFHAEELYFDALNFAKGSDTYSVSYRTIDSDPSGLCIQTIA